MTISKYYGILIIDLGTIVCYITERDMIVKDREFKSYTEYKKKMLLYPEAKLVVIYRKAQHYKKSKNIFLRAFWSLRWLRIRRVAGCQISLDAKIGRGLCLLHYGTRIIVRAASIGEYCTIGVNVIVGYGKGENGYGAPSIGNRVYIGHNSSVVGEINIGDNVLIAPNTFVNRDVPSDSIVVGNNEIIHKEYASAPYIDFGRH